MDKKVIMLGMLVGSAVGSFVPLLWGGNLLSFSSIIFTVIGGIFGIWSAYKLANL